jgi:NADH oxidase (H2O2-forming)
VEDYYFSKAFSEQLGRIATEKLRETSVNVKTSEFVDEIIGKEGKVSSVRLKSNQYIEADAVILSIGYKPNTEIAAKAGLPLNNVGAIIVDNYERTINKDICAVGDCSQTIGFLTGRTDYIMLASTATAEARVLGYNLFNIRIKKNFTGTLGIFSSKINGFTMAAAGINEKNAAEANVEYMVAEFADVDRHPGTLPGSHQLTLKLYFSPSDGTILGGEVWGGDCAGEIINIIGLAIQKSVTIYELVSYQIGTHPLLTSAPTKPLIIKAAEMAIGMLRKLQKN